MEHGQNFAQSSIDYFFHSLADLFKKVPLFPFEEFIVSLSHLELNAF